MKRMHCEKNPGYHDISEPNPLFRLMPMCMSCDIQNIKALKNEGEI